VAIYHLPATYATAHKCGVARETTEDTFYAFWLLMKSGWKVFCMAPKPRAVIVGALCHPNGVLEMENDSDGLDLGKHMPR